MLPGLTVPGSLAVLLQGFRSCFRLRPFEVFCLLAVGMVTQTGSCTVTGMLIGAGMQTVTSHHRAHRFFSAHAWSADQLGLAMARLIVATLLPAGAALDVAVDDSLFRRRGAKVHGTFWTHDASQPGQVTARGNRWVIVGIVVALPFGCRPTCLPVLFRLWGGKATTTPVQLARTLVGLGGVVGFPTGPSTWWPTPPTTANPCTTCPSGSPGPPASSATACSTSPRRPRTASEDAPAPRATGSALPPRPQPAAPGVGPP
jgi:DDE superfamily endonuclease